MVSSDGHDHVRKPAFLVHITEQVGNHPIQSDIGVDYLLAVGSVVVTGEIRGREAYRKQIRELIRAERLSFKRQFTKLCEVLRRERSKRERRVEFLPGLLIAAGYYIRKV